MAISDYKKPEEFSEMNFSIEEREGSGEFELARETITDIRDLTGGSMAYSPRITTLNIKGKDYPLLIEQSPVTLAKHILHHNSLHGYTLVTLIGKSGTGKSTMTRMMTHYLHAKAESVYGKTYVPLWFKQKDIESLDDIIASLEVGVNRILNFEDVSFTFNDSDPGELEEVMRKLTYIRHTLKANVIIQMQIHYSKALDKFLRDGDVKIITSSSDEEKENLKRLFGRDGNKAIRLFASKYHSMETNGFWSTQVSMTKMFKYQVQNPFRLALVSDVGKLHNVLYHDVSCEYCKPKFGEGLGEEKKYDNYQTGEYLKQVADTYSLSRLRTILKTWMYFKEGINVLEPNGKHVMSKLTEYFQANPEKYQEFVGEVKEARTLDQVLRKLGVFTGKETHAEKRKKRSLNVKEYNLRKKLLERQSNGKPVEVTTEQLEAAGVPSMNPGPMSDEDIAIQEQGEGDQL